jgi:hypothetical protein
MLDRWLRQPPRFKSCRGSFLSKRLPNTPCAINRALACEQQRLLQLQQKACFKHVLKITWARPSLVHDHPSNAPDPNQADRTLIFALTLNRALNLIGTQTLDQ